MARATGGAIVAGPRLLAAPGMPLDHSRFGRSLLTPRVVAALAIVAAAAAAVAGLCGLATFPDATNRLRDDAFYEFAWSANVAAGRGPAVSDGVHTSGVQLLWSLLLVPIVWAGGAAALPLAAPWLGFAVHVLTAALWWRTCRDRATAWCIAACWLGHPLLVRECQNGQETALACLFASLLWLCRRSSEVRFTALALGAVFARADLIFLVAALSLWRHRSAFAATAPLLVLLASVSVNGMLGGGLLPDSAAPMAWLWHHNQQLADPTWNAWLARVWWFLRPALLGGPFALASAMGIGFAVFAVVRPWWPARLRALPAIIVGVAAASGARDLATPGWAALLLALLPAARRRALPPGLLPLLLGLAGIVVLHWAVRWYPRDYYVAPLVVAAVAASAQHGRCRVLLLVFALAQLFGPGGVAPEPLGGQREMEMAGRLLDDVLPPGERVGCFNSGLVTFHADVLAAPGERRAIVNLDGVVNAPAFAALRRGELGAWLDRERVRFVLDNAVQFALDPRLPHANGPHFGGGFDPVRDLVEVARFDVPDAGAGRPGGDSMRLYWRRGRGEAPPRSGVARELGADGDGARYVAWPARAGEVLETEGLDGARTALVAVDADTTAVVRVAAARVGSRRLFLAGRSEPLLVLQSL